MQVKPRFAIGATIQFGDDPWKITKYHQVFGNHEVMLVSPRGEHRSLPIYQLERMVRAEEEEARKREEKAEKKRLKRERTQ